MEKMTTPPEENNLDLYADTEDLKLMDLRLQKLDGSLDNQNLMPNPEETDDIFDDVITSRICCKVEAQQENIGDRSRDGEDCVAPDVSSGVGGCNENSSPVKRFNVYVGNLTWWTTDQDLENLVKDAGVEDLIELKIFDNRVNGQSKGYCNISVSSEQSIRLIHEKLNKKEIHGKEIMVAAPTKNAIAQFEAQSDCKPRPSCSGGSTGIVRGQMQPGMPVPAPPYGPPVPGGPRMMCNSRVNRNFPGPGVGTNSPTNNSRMNLGPPHHHQAPPPGPPLHMTYGPQRPHLPPFHSHNQRPFRPYHPSAGHLPNSSFRPSSPRMDHHHRGPPPPRGDWIRVPGPHQHPPPPPQCPPGPGSMVVSLPPQEILGSHSPQGGPLNELPPAPHVNPAFFQPSYSPPISVRSPETHPHHPPKAREHQVKSNTYDSPSSMLPEGQTPCRYNGLTESEIDEVVGRNRTVSSSAISRAVADAAKGDFASAIETLVTAISLIKQSRVGNDDRCKILVTSLQDTLHGIETKSYGRVRVLHLRSKSRSRSRERGRLHRRRNHRHRSRSRSRGRSRSRDRYFTRRRSRSRSSSRGNDFERTSKYDDRSDRYRDHERERYKGEHDREREPSSKSSRSSRGHERNEDHDHTEHRAPRR